MADADADSAAHVAAARALAEDLLVPQAEIVDASSVPPSHLAALQAAGLLGVTAPTEHGGGGAPAAVGREVTEVLAGACGATWFVATQHATPLRTLLRSDNEQMRARWLRSLASSEQLAGLAVSGLRRPRPPVTARPDGAHWCLDGRVDWMTSWGLADVILLAGVTTGDDAEVVFALVGAHRQPGLTPSRPLHLAAMQGARNVSLQLDGLRVRRDDLLLREPLASWLETDRLITANVTPAVFGLLRTILDRLAQTAAQRRSAAGADLAAALTVEAADLRQRGYGLIDDLPPADGIVERLAIRAHALELVNRAATALVTAGAGTSMLATHPAQRLAREALFHLVQAQTPAVRDATLNRLAAR